MTERAFVCGRTGTGKSYLARRWIRGWRSGIAVDHKHDGIPAVDMPGWEVVVGFRSALALWGPAHPRLIVRPVHGDLHPVDDSAYDELAERVLMAGWTGWYDDEVANVAGVGRITRGLSRLQGEGRSRSCPVVVATQRPIGVHNKLLSEADHLVVFALQLKGDREKLAAFAGEQLLDPRALDRPHSFAHFRASTGQLTIYRAL
jgi:DNA helicase HerA-like ATPase